MSHPSDPSVPPTTEIAPVGASPVPPAKASPLAKAVVALLIVGLAVPVFGKIRAAQDKQKAMEADRKQVAAEASAKESAPPTVKVVRATPANWKAEVPFDGTLHPIHEAALAFKATGALSVLKVKTGDYVEKGVLLGSLDAAEAGASASAASAQVKAAEAQVAIAKDNDDLQTGLVKSGAAPAINSITSGKQLALAYAQLEAAKAQAALAGANVRNHTLVAPFAGFVTQAPSSVGGLVVAGQPAFTIKDVAQLKLVGTVSEADAALVKVDAEVALVVGEGPSRKTAKAKVLTVLPAVDPATRRVPVEALLDNEQKLLAGSFARATIAGGNEVPVLELPAATLRPGSQDEVLVVKKGKILIKKLTFVRSATGALLVRSGLGAEDDVVLSPTAEAKDGDKVTTP